MVNFHKKTAGPN